VVVVVVVLDMPLVMLLVLAGQEEAELVLAVVHTVHQGL
jgi:hypothetical protein